VRCGRPEAIRDDLKPYMADRLGGPSAVETAEVVLATTTAVGGNLFVKAKFPLVLMDEVAQATEPSVLVPVTHGCRQLVLLGDHKQLRPTVVSDRAAEGGLRFSLFERLIKCGAPPLMLDTQYRMHPSLCAFPSLEFYKGKLLSGVLPEARPQLRGFRWPRPDVSVALVPSRSPEDGGAASSSKRNQGEAQQLVSVLRAVLAEGELSGKEVGVVTPYKAQVAALRQLIHQGLPGGRAVEVMSVDGFQGREKEVRRGRRCEPRTRQTDAHAACSAHTFGPHVHAAADIVHAAPDSSSSSRRCAPTAAGRSASSRTRAASTCCSRARGAA
jgi:superfamily I DNA and/or RNA helicase